MKQNQLLDLIHKNIILIFEIFLFTSSHLFAIKSFPIFQILNVTEVTTNSS